VDDDKNCATKQQRFLLLIFQYSFKCQKRLIWSSASASTMIVSSQHDNRKILFYLFFGGSFYHYNCLVREGDTCNKLICPQEKDCIAMIQKHLLEVDMTYARITVPKCPRKLAQS